MRLKVKLQKTQTAEACEDVLPPLLFQRFYTLSDVDGLGGVPRALKGGDDADLSAHAQTPAFDGAGGCEVDLVVFIIARVLQGEQAAVEIEIGDLDGKGEGRARSGKDIDFARQAAVGALSGEANVHQRAGFYVLEDGRGLAIADARVLIDGKAHGHGIDGVTQGKLAVLGVNFDDLAIGISRKLGHADADIAGKNIMPIIVKLGIDIDALAFFECELSGFSAVAKDVSTLVKIDGPVAAAEDVDVHFVAHAVHAGDRPSYQRSDSAGHGRRIKDGIVAISCQRAGSGGAIEDFRLGLSRRSRRHGYILLLGGLRLLAIARGLLRSRLLLIGCRRLGD